MKEIVQLVWIGLSSWFVALLWEQWIVNCFAVYLIAFRYFVELRL